MIKEIAKGANAEATFGIVTALPLELEAVRAQLEDVNAFKFPREPLIYYMGKIKPPRKRTYTSVVVVKSLGPGNIDAAGAATKILEHFHTRVILMVGIAAGNENKVKLGDVVVANRIYYFDLDKITAKGVENRSWEPDSEHSLVEASIALTHKFDWKKKLIEARPDNAAIKPKIHHGIIGSSGSVIASTSHMAKLVKARPGLLAVAMEGGGVAKAVAVGGRQALFTEIRAVSDYGNDHKPEHEIWQPYAANVVAVYAINLLKLFATLPSVIQPTKSRTIRSSTKSAKAKVTSTRKASPTETTPSSKNSTISNMEKQETTDRIKSILIDKTSRNVGFSDSLPQLDIVFSPVYNSQLIDLIEFDNEEFTNKITNQMRQGAPSLISATVATDKKVSSTKLSIFTIPTRQEVEGKIEVTIYTNGSLHITFKGIALLSKNRDLNSVSLNRMYVEPSQLELRLKQAWNFAIEWWKTDKRFITQIPILYNIGLYNLGSYYTLAEAPSPKEMMYHYPHKPLLPNPLLAYSEPRQVTPELLKSLAQAITHSVKTLKLIYKDY